MKNGNWKINRSKAQLPFGRKIYYQQIKEKVHFQLGNKCIKCGFNDRRALQIDHINSDGFIERKSKALTGINYFNYILKNIKNGQYQLLCANCNWIKRHENKEIKNRYDENHIFPVEEPHIRKFKIKICVKCNKEYVPTSGPQLFCSKLCIKG